MQRLQHLAAGAIPGTVQCGDHPVRAVERIGAVGGLRHTVRIDHQPVSGVQLQLILPVPGTLHAGQHEAVLVLEQFKIPAFAHDGRVLMARVGALHLPRGYFQDTQPHGDEHLRVVVLAQLVVDLLQHCLGGQAALSRRLQQRLGDHHEQRGRDTLAGHVRHDHRQMVVVH